MLALFIDEKNTEPKSVSYRRQNIELVRDKYYLFNTEDIHFPKHKGGKETIVAAGCYDDDNRLVHIALLNNPATLYEGDRISFFKGEAGFRDEGE